MTTTPNRKGKRTWLSWSLPVIGLALVTWYYLAHDSKPLPQRSGYVYLDCQPFPVANGSGWGYDILADGKTYIHQDRLPGVPGIHPFATREDALKVGRLMISKLKAGTFPPHVSYQEMQGMGITVN